MITVTKKKLLFSLLIFFMLAGMVNALTTPYPMTANPYGATSGYTLDDTPNDEIGSNNGDNRTCVYSVVTNLTSGSSLYCNGDSGDYFNTAITGEIDTSKNFSISYWIKYVSTGDPTKMLFSDDGTDSIFMNNYNANAAGIYLAWHNPEHNIRTVDDITVADGWTHFVIAHGDCLNADVGCMDVYQDGELMVFGDRYSAGDGGGVIGGILTFLGDTGNTQNADAYIDDILIFNDKKLTSAQANAIYTGVYPTPYPLSNPYGAEVQWNFNDSLTDRLQSLSMTNSGTAYSTDTPFLTGKSILSNSGDYLDMNWNNVSMNEAYTFSFWWKGDVNGQHGAYGTGSGGVSWYEASDTMDWYIIDSAGNNDYRRITSPYTTVWNHQAYVHEAGQGYDKIKMYVNGAEQGYIFDNTENIGAGSQAIDTYWFCRNTDDSQTGCIDGDAYMDDLAVFKTALEPSQIQTIYLGNYTGSSTPTAPTNSTWEYTNPNIVSGEVNTTWDTGGTINVTSNNASFTFTASVASNWSCSPYNYNYTNMIAAYPTSKLTTTDTTAQNLIDYPFDLTHEKYSDIIPTVTSDYINLTDNSVSTAGDIFVDFDLTFGEIIHDGANVNSNGWSGLLDSGDCTGATYNKDDVDLVANKYMCVNTSEQNIDLLKVLRLSPTIDFVVVSSDQVSTCIYCSGIAAGIESSASSSGCLDISRYYYPTVTLGELVAIK